MAGFHPEEVGHLKHLKRLQEPMLLTVRDRPPLELAAPLDGYLRTMSYLQAAYSSIPYSVADWMRKFLSYRGSNPAIKAAGSILRSALFARARSAGHEVTNLMVLRGLGYAQEATKLQRASAGNAVAYGSGVGYDSEEHDLAIAQRYKAWHDAGRHFATEEEQLGTLFHFAIHNTDAFLKRSQIKQLVNFGACYGIVEHELAKRNPGIHFVGIDRAKKVKAFNDDLFRAPNLEYVAADIIEYLSNADLGDTALMVMRTAMVFPEPFIKTLFDTLQRQNVRAAIGLEPFGYSLAAGRFLTPSEEYQPSLHYRGAMFLHNYPYFCAQAGLVVTQTNWLAHDKQQGDEFDLNWIYCLIAERVTQAM